MGTAIQYSRTQTGRTGFAISASAGANGSIDPTGAVPVAAGEDQTFTIQASVGYVIASLVVDGESIEPAGEYTFTNVHRDHTIRATFAEEPPIEP